MLLLIVGITLLAALGTFASAFGVDTRDGFGDRP
jgi:hypothetical protein